MAKLTPPLSVRLMVTADALHNDADALDRLARGDDAEKVRAIARRVKRAADALDTMTLEADRDDAS